MTGEVDSSIKKKREQMLECFLHYIKECWEIGIGRMGERGRRGQCVERAKNWQKLPQPGFDPGTNGS